MSRFPRSRKRTGARGRSSKCRLIDLIEEVCPGKKSLAEVAAGTPDRTRFAQYCNNGRDRVLLVEPGPGYPFLFKEWGDSENVDLLQLAVDDKLSRVKLWLQNDLEKNFYNGHTSDCPHYHPPDPDEWHYMMCPAVPFYSMDPLDLDALLLDVEGSELKVLTTMVSRPKVICVEIRQHRRFHTARHGIYKWMKDEGYKKLFSEALDDVFVLAEEIG